MFIDGAKGVWVCGVIWQSKYVGGTAVVDIVSCRYYSISFQSA